MTTLFAVSSEKRRYLRCSGIRRARCAGTVGSSGLSRSSAGGAPCRHAEVQTSWVCDGPQTSVRIWRWVEHVARVMDQCDEERYSIGVRAHFPVGEKDAPPRRIDPEITDMNTASSGRPAPAAWRSATRMPGSGTRRFRTVESRSRLRPRRAPLLVVLLISGREHHHWNARPLAESPDDLDPRPCLEGRVRPRRHRGGCRRPR